MGAVAAIQCTRCHDRQSRLGAHEVFRRAGHDQLRSRGAAADGTPHRDSGNRPGQSVRRPRAHQGRASQLDAQAQEPRAAGPMDARPASDRVCPGSSRLLRSAKAIRSERRGRHAWPADPVRRGGETAGGVGATRIGAGRRAGRSEKARGPGARARRNRRCLRRVPRRRPAHRPRRRKRWPLLHMPRRRHLAPQ